MPSDSFISILLLAAGSSSRLGQPKQLLPYNGKTLLRRVAEIAVASQAQETCVILGFDSERMKQELRDLPVRIVENRDWNEGIHSSIRAGINALPSTANAALILLCDQPLITTELLNTITTTFRSTTKLIVASNYAGTLGVPVLFARRLFPQLTGLTGDKGAKHIIQKYRDEAVSVPFPGGEVDIDSQSDLAQL